MNNTPEIKELKKDFELIQSTENDFDLMDENEKEMLIYSIFEDEEFFFDDDY